jgi:hypothetical protein
MKGHLVFSNAHEEAWTDGGECNFVLPLQTSSLDSTHDQNVGTTPQRPGLLRVWGVVPAESIAPTR